MERDEFGRLHITPLPRQSRGVIPPVPNNTPNTSPNTSPPPPLSPPQINRRNVLENVSFSFNES